MFLYEEMVIRKEYPLQRSRFSRLYLNHTNNNITLFPLHTISIYKGKKMVSLSHHKICSCKLKRKLLVLTNNIGTWNSAFHHKLQDYKQFSNNGKVN